MNPTPPCSIPDYSLFFNSLAVVLAIITVGITVVGGYVAIVLRGLGERIEKRVASHTAVERERILRLVRAKLAALDTALEVITSNGTDEQRRERIYGIRHVVRLASEDDNEVRLALNALEALGKQAVPLLPLAVRIQAATQWSQENDRLFRALLDRAQAY